jgi:hypothetical protein
VVQTTAGTARIYTTAVGVYSQTSLGAGGSIGTWYGFYMPTCSGTTRYGIYVADTGAGNTLLGWLNVGAGTAASVAGHVGALRYYVNSTAYLDGANAGRIGITGTLDAFGITDAHDVAVGTVTGSKIATAANQKLGFWGHVPAVQPSAYTPSNVSADRAYDANATSIDELADVLGTLIADLQGVGLLS